MESTPDKTYPIDKRNAGSWEFALLLFALSLKKSHIKEQLWAICSRRSLKKNDSEQITLNFFKKEQCQWFAHDSSEGLLKHEWFAWKKLIFHLFFTVFALFMPKSSSLPLLFAQSLFFNPNPPDPLPLLLPADLYAIPFSTVCVSYLDQVSW